MAGFNIDDVRGTIGKDITQFLDRIEKAAGVLADTERAPRLEDVKADSPPFQVIGEAGHAIYGTSALVSAESLASSARLLERLAERGHSELAAAARHANRARQIAEAVRTGALEMRTMLQLELEHRGEDAQWIALEWQGSAGELLAAATQVAELAKRASVVPPDTNGKNGSKHPEAETELLAFDETTLEPVGEPGFTFSEAPPADAEPRDPIQQELLEIFQQEARENLVALQGHIATLFGDHQDLAAARAVERIYHTLKGAAATVGLTEVSGKAHGLQRRMQSIVEDGAPLTRDVLDDLVADTTTLLSLAGLPQVTLTFDRSKPPPPESAAAPPSVGIPDEAHAEFVAEAERICAEAAALLSSVEAAETGAPTAGDLVQTLAKLFHRLKGSALVVGEELVANEAASLQRVCVAQTFDEVSIRKLSEGITRIIAGAGLNPIAEAGAVRYSVRVPDPELWQAFTEECADLLEKLDAGILQLEESDQPRERLGALLPLYHTLKGVVNTMGLAPTGEMLHRVEDFIEARLASAVLPSMRALATFLLEVQVHVRKSLKQAKKGFVELSLPRFEEGLARVTVDARPKPTAGEAQASAHDSESAGSSRSEADREARKYVRVPAERLDNLMDLAGELVVSRSRLLSRVQHLRTVQTEIGRGSRLLVDTVERFADEHEFARIDDKAFVARGENGLALAAGGEGSWTAFSDLELDRYEDVHVLSRSLTELTNDFGELYAELEGGLRALTDDSDAFGGIVGGIQTEITRARMVPLEVLFSRLRLPIRDAAVREDKEARVATEGGSIHLDKAIADALFQPMVHLVRNAVAHGLESAAGRKSAGKAPAGSIELVARQELGQVIIEVRDDGAGLDLGKLRAQGVAMGFLDENTSVDDPSVKDLVFAPGLTTQSAARAVAGRGIGCDFVRRSVERLNGSVRVESERGKGARFILALPITLAIAKALLVKQGGHSYALPLYFAERILDLQDQEVVDSVGTRRVRLDDAFLTVTSLSKVLGTKAERSTGPIVVLRAGAERVLLQVDAVVGQEEIVVKKLGPILTGHPLFAGVTIRGTGEMVLILDVPGLAESRLATGRSARKQAARDDDFFRRPIAEVAPSPPEPASQSEHSLDEPLNVLFVDDSLSVRKVAEKALAALGANVTLAVDGVDALTKIRLKRFDLVFTDLEMPRMHGFELIRELRFLDAYRTLPIIVVTSRSGQKHQDQARSLGATEYLTKPFTPRSLEATLRKWGRAKHTGDA